MFYGNRWRQNAKNRLCKDNSCKKALKQFDLKFDRIYSFVKKEQLSDCQTACIVKCISSNLIKYNFEWKEELYGPGAIIKSRSGSCKDFSTLNRYMSNKVGLPTSIKASYKQNHVFVQQKINGMWYYAEPQLSSCKFYYSQSQRESPEISP